MDWRGELVTLSFELAAERCEDLTPLVYARLFAQQPQMLPHFWRDTSGAIKGEMLARVIEAILDFVDERQYADHLIQCEVMTHDGYDVPPDVFATFFGVVAADDARAARRRLDSRDRRRLGQPAGGSRFLRPPPRPGRDGGDGALNRAAAGETERAAGA